MELNCHLYVSRDDFKPMQAKTKPTAIIVGAGPGGLASAMLLAYSGVDVTVIEKESKVGGRTKLVEKDGFTYDRGPTFSTSQR